MADQIIQIDVPEGATDIVIFVHGFGVRYDSRGMFTDIKKSLPSNWGTVLFDFYSIDGNNVYLSSIEDQVKLLRDLVSDVKSKNSKSKIHLIAHSMGCIIVALSGLSIDGKAIFLAPPDNFGDGILEQYFRGYDGAKEQSGTLIVPRKDGTTSHIPLAFFKQMTETNPLQAMIGYSKKQNMTLVQTTKDDVIGSTNYGELVNLASIIKLPADHNFTGKGRKALIEKISVAMQKR